LFYRLWWRDLGELVSMMEHDLGCSMETHYELCESHLCGGDFKGAKGQGKEIYIGGWLKEEGNFLANR
jgi:hypothetical protein